MSHQKPQHNVGYPHPVQQQKHEWNMVPTGMDAPRTAERKRRGRMVDYIDSLPTPPSTKNTRSRRNQSHHHSDGLPTPSTSSHKQHPSQTSHDHRASPISKSRRLGADGVDLQAEAGAESGSSDVEQDVQAAMTSTTEKRWLGRRGSRRPGLTFAQQMGLLVSRSSSDQHQTSTAAVSQSDWRPTGIMDGHTTEVVVEKSFYYSGASSSKRDHSHKLERLAVQYPEPTLQKSEHGNPFLDETDEITNHISSKTETSRSIPLRKSASGRLLDPVDLVSSDTAISSLEPAQGKPHSQSGASCRTDLTTSPSEYQIVFTVQPGSPAEEAGSETEKEENEDEEEDDSPYLIEDGDFAGPNLQPENGNQSLSAERIATIDNDRSGSHLAEELDESSGLSEVPDVNDDEEEFEAIEVDEGRLSPVKAVSTVKETRKSRAITRYLSSAKASSSLSDSEKSHSESTAFPESQALRRPKRSRSRERKTWGKPILGNVDENPFLASSAVGRARDTSTGTADAGGSWLRTDNAKSGRSEGEKPTIDYVFRGQKTTFANPYYRHDPYRPPATSLLPPEHPDFSPAPIPAPRMLFPKATDGEGGSSNDDQERALPQSGRRDILPGLMRVSPSSAPSAVPATRTLQRRISSQIPPLARQGSTLLEKAQRAQTERRRPPPQTQPESRVRHGKKRSMEAVLGEMEDAGDEEDELLLRDVRAGRRLLFGNGTGAAAARERSDHQQQQAHAGSRAAANKKIKMEHVMGE